MFEPHPAQHMKIVRYPGNSREFNQQGVGAHKDGGLITVLLNDEHDGLRVLQANGQWVDAPPMRGYFIVNTGELLELITDGYVRADVHSVVTPPEGVNRYSIPFFLGANLHATLPRFHVIGDMKRALRGVSEDPGNRLFQDVGTNHLKARLRSHPDVAQAHYHDVRSGPNGFALVLAGYLAFAKTRFGLIARAAMVNPELVSVLGFNRDRIYAVTFFIGAALSGLAGGLLAPISGVTPHMGAAYVAKAFVTVISGGSAVVSGLLSASLLLGPFEAVVSFLSTPMVGQAALLLVAIVLLRIYPKGISGLWTGER